MSEALPDPDEWERVDSNGYGGGPVGSEDNPMVSVYQDGQLLGLTKWANEKLGRPDYVCFFKTGSFVIIEPHEDEEGLNPHKVAKKAEKAKYGMVSFEWHECEKNGYAPLRHDDERNVCYFDTEEIEDGD